MKILKAGNEIGSIDRTMTLVSTDAELQKIYALIKKEGIEAYKLGKGNEDVRVNLPVTPQNVGWLKTEFEEFGYDVRI